jgi:hypothetical protein
MNEFLYTIFEFLIAVTKNIFVFQGVTLCNFVEIYVSEERTFPSFRAESFPLARLEAMCFSELSTGFCKVVMRAA